MYRVYKQESDGLLWWEAWEEDNKWVVRSGRVGGHYEEQVFRKIFLIHLRSKIEKFLTLKLEEGFKEVPLSQFQTLVIEFNVKDLGMTGSDSKLTILYDKLNDILDEVGLGSYSGEYFENETVGVYCSVIDYDAAERSLKRVLKNTIFNDYLRIYESERKDVM